MPMPSPPCCRRRSRVVSGQRSWCKLPLIAVRSLAWRWIIHVNVSLETVTIDVSVRSMVVSQPASVWTGCEVGRSGGSGLAVGGRDRRRQATEISPLIGLYIRDDNASMWWAASQISAADHHSDNVGWLSSLSTLFSRWYHCGLRLHVISRLWLSSLTLLKSEYNEVIGKK